MKKKRQKLLTKLERRKRVNAFAVIFLFFLYSLTTLPGMYVSQGMLTAFLSVIIFFPVILLNLTTKSTNANKIALIIDVVILFILMFELLVYNQYSDAIQDSILNMATIGSIGLLIGSLDFKLKDCVRYGQPLAIICAVTSLLYLWLVPNKFLMSMRFGYAFLPSVLWFLMMAIYKRSVFNLILFSGGTITLIAWGSRGTLLVIIIFLILYFIKFHKVSLTITLLVIIPMLTILRGYLLMFLDRISDFTHARKIEKIISMVNENSLDSSSSGRDILYDRCIDVMELNPLGNGVGWWSVDPFMNGLFPHNIILQVGTEFGIIGLAILIYVLFVSLKNTFSFDNIEFLLLIFIISITLGRLMVSSMYWARPEFWLYIAMFMCANIRRNNMIVGQR